MNNHFKCPITGQSVSIERIKPDFSTGQTLYYYPVDVNYKERIIVLCLKLYNQLRFEDNLVRMEISKVSGILAYEFLKSDFESLGGHILHWDCDEFINKPQHIVLKSIIPKLLMSNKYPKNRKQKADNILKYLYDSQGQEGGKIQLFNDISIWGNLFMKNYNELLFYVEELERKKLVLYDTELHCVRLTFEGLDTIENIIETSRSNQDEFFEPQYDIGLSFAGEERSYVEQVADELTKIGIKVFYDNYETFDLWGKDLYQHLNDVYRNKCKYCIIFISKNYAKKLWTRHELKAAQAKAFTENEEYILPIRFDETELPGINPQTGYLIFKDYTPYQIAEMASKKLNK